MKSPVKINSHILFPPPPHPQFFVKSNENDFKKITPSFPLTYRNLQSLEMPVDSTTIKRRKCLKVSSDEPSCTSLISYTRKFGLTGRRRRDSSNFPRTTRFTANPSLLFKDLIFFYGLSPS